MNKLNLKSNILKISIVIAVIFMLLPAIAAEDIDGAADEASPDADVIEEVQDDATLEQTDESISVESVHPVPPLQILDDGTLSRAPAADLQVFISSTTQYAKVGDIIGWTIAVGNNGPDDAENVIVQDVILTGDFIPLNASSSVGFFDLNTGIWYVGDLESGAYEWVNLFAICLTEDPIASLVYVMSDTPDPNPYNNFALNVINAPAAEVSAAEETMPAAGNPIALALLALISIVGVTFTRRD